MPLEEVNKNEKLNSSNHKNNLIYISTFTNLIFPFTNICYSRINYRKKNWSLTSIISGNSGGLHFPASLAARLRPYDLVLAVEYIQK